MIKSFLQFINENMDHKTEFIKELAQNLIDRLRTSSLDESTEYSIFAGMQFTEPFEFTLELKVRREISPDIKSDSHFKSLPWEKINFDNLGYAIDANTKLNKSESKIPKIVIHILMDPKKEPLLYSKLYYRIIDILTHETNHLNQLGINREPFNTKVSNINDREASKKSYKYFLLPDEIESMVEGMYARSQAENTPLDYIFTNYLTPFIESEYITQNEYLIVMKAWVTRSLELYPDAEFSARVKSIVNSI